MIINISTHQGLALSTETDFILIHNEEYEFGILKNHIPVISVINDGYVRIKAIEKELYAYIYGGIFEFHNNEAVLLAQEVALADSLDKAKEKIEKSISDRREINRQDSINFTKKEKELREHIKAAKISEL